MKKIVFMLSLCISSISVFSQTEGMSQEEMQNKPKPPLPMSSTTAAVEEELVGFEEELEEEE